MARGRFDPARAVGGPSPAPDSAGGDPKRPIPVSALATLITRALEAGVPTPVAVVGEVSGASLRTHWYFSLKDEGAVVSCVMFASDAARSAVAPADGQSVIAIGRVGFFARQGRAQLYIDRLIAVGEGELERRFKALCEELRTLGWFADERKRPVPMFPRRIGIVTSRTGAALQDVLDTMRRRCPAVEAAIVDVRVQGEGSAAQVAAAIRWLSVEHERLGIDAILVVRGGGSIEDLWAFNERIVAEAIVHAAVPVVAAIGHETDVTIAELVADVRAATPTQAAMRITPDRAALTELLDAQRDRLTALTTRTIRTDKARLDALARRRGLADPRVIVADRREALARAASALPAAMRARLADAALRVERRGTLLARLRPERVLTERRERLGAMAARMHREARGVVERLRHRVDAMERELIVAGPASVLARGYSVTTDAEGRPIRSAAAVAPGERVRTRVADGSFDSTVAGDGPAQASAPVVSPATPMPPRTRPASKSKPPPDDREQMRLF